MEKITAPDWQVKVGKIVALVLGMVVFHLRIITLPQHGIEAWNQWDTNTMTVFSLIVFAVTILTGIPKKEIKWSELEPMFGSAVSGSRVQAALGYPTRILITLFLAIIILHGLGYNF